MSDTKETPKTLVIEREGEYLTYRVSSSTKPGLGHVVDLTANNGMGVCTCEFYLFTVAKNQRAGKFIEWAKGRKGVTECRHIYASRRNFHRKRVMPFFSDFHKGEPEDLAETLRAFFKWKGL